MFNQQQYRIYVDSNLQVVAMLSVIGLE